MHVNTIFCFFQPIVTSEAPTKKENIAEDTVKNEKKKKKKEKSKKSSENEQKVEEVEEESEKIRDTKQKEVDDSKVKADYGFLKDPKALKRTQSLVKSGVKWLVFVLFCFVFCNLKMDIKPQNQTNILPQV